MGRLKRKRGKTNLSGLAGNIELYTVKGETFFKTHAKKHRKSKSKEAVRGRSNFASVVKMARDINKVEILKEVWSHSSLPGRNGYQKLIRYNMPLAYEGNLTIKNFITPKGKELFIDDYKIEKEIASFTMDLYGLIKPPIVIHIFYYWYNSKDPRSAEFFSTYAHINISQENADEIRKRGESRYNIMYKVDGDFGMIFNRYKDVVILIAVTGISSIPKRKYWTNTVGFDIPLI